MGSVAVQDLAESPADEVVVAGRSLEKAKEVAAKYRNTSAAQIDATDKDLVQKLRYLRPDVVVNAVQYQFNLKIMAAAIKAGVNYLDLGGLYHMTLKQLKLHARARKAGVLCLLGMGSTPGTMNVMAGYAAKKLGNIEKIELRSGWRILERLPRPIIPYSADTIYDEFTMKCPVFRNSKMRMVDPMEKEIEFRFQEPLGEVVGHYAIHSELATMPKTIDKGVKDIDFAVAYPRQFTDLVTNIIKKYKNKRRAIAELEHETVLLQREPWDIDGQRAELFGTRSRIRLESITTYYKKWKRGSAIDTAVPPSIAAQWIASGKLQHKGVLPPEVVFEGQELPYFKELYKHTGGNIKVYESIDGGKPKPLFK